VQSNCMKFSQEINLLQNSSVCFRQTQTVVIGEKSTVDTKNASFDTQSCVKASRRPGKIFEDPNICIGCRNSPIGKWERPDKNRFPWGEGVGTHFCSANVRCSTRAPSLGR
jgi:hypothetical protein